MSRSFRSPFGILMGSLVALGACSGSSSGPLTEIVVVVDTDLAIPSQVKALRIVARGPDGTPKMVGGALTGANTITLPLSFGATSQTGGTFSVTATGVGPSDSPVIVRDVVTEFIEGERRILHIVLGAECYQRACPDSETCLEGGVCGSPDVSADDLPTFEGEIPEAVGTSAAPDASAQDAGVSDAAMADAQTTPDAGSLCGEGSERSCASWRPDRGDTSCGRVVCLPSGECGFDPEFPLVSCASGFECDYSIGSCGSAS